MAESKYFLDKMNSYEEVGKVDEFQFMLSAFLSSSRSVLQYLHKYRKRWYLKHIGDVKFKQFFKDKRDENIHNHPVSTTHTGSADALSTIVVNRKDSNSEADYLEFDVEIRDVVEHDYKFYFSDTDHSQTINVLSAIYLGQIEGILVKLTK